MPLLLVLPQSLSLQRADAELHRSSCPASPAKEPHGGLLRIFTAHVLSWRTQLQEQPEKGRRFEVRSRNLKYCQGPLAKTNADDRRHLQASKYPRSA